ncbi:hypothetical protein M5689_019179 [Euphorbia peplus]|nr:hypothetical protein M5689_019179 [Euphorbia peplus]
MATSKQLCRSPHEENIDEDNPDMVIPIVSTSDTEDNESGAKPFQKKKRKKTSAVWVEFAEFKAPGYFARIYSLQVTVDQIRFRYHYSFPPSFEDLPIEKK